MLFSFYYKNVRINIYNRGDIMFCRKCGKEIINNTNFCSSCGTPVEQVVEPVVPVAEPVQPTPVQTVPVMNSTPVAPVVPVKKKKDKKGIIVIALLSVIVVGLAIVAFLMFSGGNSKRTIMIYLDGSTLETDGEIITAELASIDPNKIDLENVTILAYTGGTEEWHNDYISNTENAIFKLTKNGFEKIETYPQLNMGDPKTLSDFLEYGYKNYPAGRYNLILYDHGGAIDGAIYDDISGDNIQLDEFSKALSDSPFNSDNKFDSVIFRTCLNGTLEVAGLFEDYADYIAFSEEVSYGSKYSNVLSFLNDVKASDDGYLFAKKFVDQYKKQMEEIDIFGSKGVTYSVVDLSKIDSIIDKFDSFIEGIDLKTNYNSISKVRANLYQYASSEEKGYDTIDLYSFVEGIKSYSSVDSTSLLETLRDAVVYNYTNMQNSNGVSIYFPFNGKSTTKSRFLSVYKKLSYLDKYRSLITSFVAMQSESKPFAYNLTANETKIEDEGREVTLKLTEDELANYSNAYYIVFERSQEHPNYYMPIYRSNDVELKGDTIKTKIGNNLVTMFNDSDNQRHIIPIMYNKSDGVETYESPFAILYDTSKSITDVGFSYNVNAYFKIDGTKVNFTSAKISIDNDERTTGMLLDISKFDSIELWTPIYKITDDNGNYTMDWESAPELTGFSSKIADLDLQTSTLQNGEYYVVINIVDVNNNVYPSSLIKVGE